MELINFLSSPFLPFETSGPHCMISSIPFLACLSLFASSTKSFDQSVSSQSRFLLCILRLIVRVACSHWLKIFGAFFRVWDCCMKLEKSDKWTRSMESHVRCHCGLISPLTTSWTNFNPGRRFYGCAKYKVSNLIFFKKIS